MSLLSGFGYSRSNKILVHSTLILFVASTVLLFLYLNRVQPQYFIDEAFHVPQTLRYCAWNFTQVTCAQKRSTLDYYVSRHSLFAAKMNFTKLIFFLFQWDPKITTLPGLYLITAAILSPFNLCNITYMRFVNLIGTCVNLYLIYNVIKENRKSNRTDQQDDWLTLASAYNVTLFPPLYFWCFFYYTDVMSVNAVLLMLLLHQRKHAKATAFAGECLAT